MYSLSMKAHLSFERNAAPVLLAENELAGFYLLKEACLVLVVEGTAPAQDDEDYHANAPHVHRLQWRQYGSTYPKTANGNTRARTVGPRG